ncbi:MAG: non-ribosomal peptide synthetase, partial [Thermoactinospora sp.]|nr:non-ribosomal peptide synthetase [Thermoactinospora sp.]
MSPLSPAQRRMWFLDRLAGGDASYNMVVAVRLRGPLDVAAFARALTGFAARHEALRTVFPEADGGPVAVVRAARPIPVELVAVKRADLDAAVAERANAPFDLAAGPLVRASVLRLEPGEHVLVLVMHHIIGDAWSVEHVMFPQLDELYRAHAAGAPPPEAVAVPYLAPERDHHADLDFWREELAAVPVLELPLDRPRPAARSSRGAMVVHRVPARVWADLGRLARAERCTPFMALMAAYQVLLHRHTGQDDFCVGTPVAGRDDEASERVFGLFINTLAVRADLTGDPGVGELLKRVRRRLLRGFGHAAVPFEQVVGELGVGRDPAVPPVFQTMMMLSLPGGPPFRLGELVGEPVLSGLAPAKFDLALDVVAAPEELRLLFTYSTDVLERGTVERMAGHLERLLVEMTARPAARIGELEMLPADELALLVRRPAVRPEQVRPEQVRPVHELFAERAAADPGAPALITAGQTLSYGELDARSGALAAGLAARGVRPGE